MPRPNLAERADIRAAGAIASAQSRRTAKLAQLIETAPPLTAAQLARLRKLLDANAVRAGGAS